MLTDHVEREHATDPRVSFIVQAPAGSGKTEILTQRYLRLLGTVSAPEQIIALTFTRKAANEMRERILHALQRAARGDKAESAHQQKTESYAIAALARDTAHEWELLQQPHRLRIMTIDSLCHALTHAIPLQEKQIHAASISDKPQALYQAAALACLEFALSHDAYHQPLSALLNHLDNRQDHLIALFSDLLAKREQWLEPLYQARMQDQAMVEQGLAWIEQHALSRFRQSLPYDLTQTLTTLARQLACIENNPESPRYALCHWDSFETLDGRLAASLASLLTTSQNTLRKAFDHHVGLKRGACPDKTYAELKEASKALMSALDALPDFLEALLRVSRLPEPHYDPEQWQVLHALFTLLPVLAAHLNLTFREHNTVDFTAISQQALQALGSDESPTDLALYLDNRIQHLLVDEFQDTSLQQFQLLTQLVTGWQPHDGRTLFLVGDPMQSIYRFRAAEVGLFLRAREQGVGPVTLTPLELRCNFRSTATVVDWVNRHFKSIFPPTDDMESGAVSFHASVNVRPTDSHSYITAVQSESREQEAHLLVKHAVEVLDAHPEDNIAILVRSRNQLTHIVRLLREEGIPFQGVDIDLLAKCPHLRDLWSITQALLMPANRLAWLSVLRSPWCGLTLADLHQIANYDKSQSIYAALAQVEQMDGLSTDGRLRARFIYNVLHEALTLRYQHSLVDWILETLTKLHLEHVLTAAQHDDLEQFWLLLDQFEKDGQIEDMALFKREFKSLYSKKVTPARLQIMTIHKSKGLEFDSVMLPGLGSKSPAMDTPLFRGLKLPTEQHGDLLLLSPIKAAHHEQCVLYDYLGRLDAEKTSYEMQRLLYVAVTRARKRVYLFDHHEKGHSGTFRNLLSNQTFEADNPSIETAGLTPETTPPLWHLPIDFYQLSAAIKHTPPNALPTWNTNNAPRLIGIVAHTLLQWICNHHPASFTDIPWALAEYQLTSMGFDKTERADACALLQAQLQRMFQDPIGQWILKAHDDEHNEYELLVNINSTISTHVIDRTFCEHGVRWIIDFKTGDDNEASQVPHRSQVNGYASHFTGQPIRCGLYYLTSGRWVPWDYEPVTSLLESLDG